MRYTNRSRILLRCRRRGCTLQIEIWDIGIGIPGGELQAVFDDHHQISNETRERDRGLGLGLSIVKRLGGLLDHRVTVRFNPGAGSVFVIELPRVPVPNLRSIAASAAYCRGRLVGRAS